MLRSLLLGTTFLRAPDDLPVGAAAPVVEQPVVAAPAAIEPAAGTPGPAAEAAPALDPPLAPEPTAAVVTEPAKTDAPAAVEAPKADASLLTSATRVEPETPKAADPAKPAEAPKTDAEPGKVDGAAAPNVYEFKLPEAVKKDDAALAAYTDVLSKEGIKPEVGQALIDQHIGAMTKYAEHLANEQRRVWNETVSEWRTQSMTDPEIGGNGHKTAMTQIASVRDALFQGTELQAFNKFLDDTGAGNHPLVLKAFHRMARFMNEPAPPSIAGTPAETNGKAPGRGRGLRGLYADDRAARSGS